MITLICMAIFSLVNLIYYLKIVKITKKPLGNIDSMILLLSLVNFLGCCFFITVGFILK
jgi:hypothetical protein